MRILRTPPDILIAFLKTWDEIAAEEVAEEPVLQEGATSRSAHYASLVVPAKRFIFPPYSFAAELLLAREGSSKARPTRPTRRSSSRPLNGGGDPPPF